jgi:uncharacterized membrane protein
MVVFAHIAGLPLEETLASFGPVLLVAGGGCVAALRARLARLREVSSAAREGRSARRPRAA